MLMPVRVGVSTCASAAAEARRLALPGLHRPSPLLTPPPAPPAAVVPPQQLEVGLPDVMMQGLEQYTQVGVGVGGS